MSFRLFAPNSDLVSFEILKREEVPIRRILFADRHHPSAPQIGGVRPEIRDSKRYRDVWSSYFSSRGNGMNSEVEIA